MDDTISRAAAIDAMMKLQAEDAVSRRILLNDLKELITAWEKYPVMAEQIKGVAIAIGYVKTIPSVTPKRKTGKWIEYDSDDDTISRQAALTALERDEEYDKDIPNRSDGVRDAIITISALPSAQGWIPCSERCPEQSGWYLVSLKNGNVQKAWYRVAPINQGGSYWRSPIKRPLAWMPLPKPWEGEGHE